MYCYVSLRFLFKVFVVMSFYSYICINCFLIYYIYKRYLYIYIHVGLHFLVCMHTLYMQV